MPPKLYDKIGLGVHKTYAYIYSYNQGKDNDKLTSLIYQSLSISKTMKLIITIPAYNEEQSIGEVIKEIPMKIEGIDQIEILVINDGSTDKTVDEALKSGATKVISFKKNRGLAKAFRAGLEEAIIMDGDIIVNTDADGQYNGEEIPSLIQPIINGEADIVLGSRFKGWIEEMPIQKKLGNQLATFVTAKVSGFPTSDAQTGFRAFSREAAMRLNVLSDYTYTQETIIQSSYKGLKIVEIPVEFRKREGKSRLISNIFNYAMRSGVTIVQTFRDYNPIRTFGLIGGVFAFIGLLFGLRVLVHFLYTGMVSPFIPSAILSGVLLTVGFQIIVLGLIADMVGNNRKLMEQILYRMKKVK